MLNVSRETVTRVFQTLQNRQIVKRDGSASLRVNDLVSLKELRRRKRRAVDEAAAVLMLTAALENRNLPLTLWATHQTTTIKNGHSKQAVKRPAATPNSSHL